jgi:pimeloyl-ACP methyl ester carboxylesterase
VHLRLSYRISAGSLLSKLPDLCRVFLCREGRAGQQWTTAADHITIGFVEPKRIDGPSAYLVAQDWGTAVVFHLAARRPDFVRGLVFMEFPRPVLTWEEFLQSSAEREIFRKFRTPGEGERLIFEDNLFIEGALPNATVRKFTEEEMAVYRAPFTTPESWRPMWRFPNELPIAGEPALIAGQRSPSVSLGDDPERVFASAGAGTCKTGRIGGRSVVTVDPDHDHFPRERVVPAQASAGEIEAWTIPPRHRSAHMLRIHKFTVFYAHRTTCR